MGSFSYKLIQDLRLYDTRDGYKIRANLDIIPKRYHRYTVCLEKRRERLLGCRPRGK